jgi:hypothetical protein
LVRSLPPGEKWFYVADALDLLDIDTLEAKVIRELLRLRHAGGPGGTGMSLRQLAVYLDERGEYTSPEWLRRVYVAIEPKQPAA